MFTGRLLQIFNRYIQWGGEEDFVDRVQGILGDDRLRTLYFDSKEWVGPDAPPRWRQPFLMWNNPSAIQRIAEEHRRWRPEAWLLGNVYPVASAGVYEFARRERIPVLHFVHNFRPFSINGALWVNGRQCDAGLRRNFFPEAWQGSWQGSRLKSFIMAGILTAFHRRGLADAVDLWVPVSDFMRDKFVEAGVPRDRIATLHPFWFAAPDFKPAPEEDYYLFIGRLIEEKGLRVLLETWNLIHQERGPTGPKLRIAGRGPLEPVLRTAAEKNPLVQPLGFISNEDKVRLISGCRAMLAPSLWWEALGIVTCEAFERARPMLGARSGGITEMIRHGENGLLHTPGDATELARQVLDLDADADRRRAMGLAGREWLLANMSPERWKQQLHQLVGRVLNRKT